jgi:UDP-2,4-diacetamido-2,4,6-trideoxy-beta-L-altropyranose hydrolase
LKPKNILIRADASIKIGSGHVMRCLTLAEKLREGNNSVTFISRLHDGNLNHLIKEKKFDVIELPPHSNQSFQGNDKTYLKWLGCKQSFDAKDCIASIQASSQMIDLLIVDHYALDEQWERALRPWVKKIMVVDDLADRTHDCDILLDQNYYIKRNRYYNLVPNQCLLMLGPSYAMLRKEFSETRNKIRARSGKIERIIVFYGGVDNTNETKKALKALRNLNRPEIHIDTVIGISNPNKKNLEDFIQTMPNNTLHIQVDNIAHLMAKADLAIGAGGSSNWERCCLGLSAIVVSIAENQQQMSRDLSIRNIQEYLGSAKSVKIKDIQTMLIHLLSNPERVKLLSDNSFRVTDGLGVNNIVQEL